MKGMGYQGSGILALYEHCIGQLIELKFGEHGIPLMGSGIETVYGTVGNKGKGESIWLGWFIYDFKPIYTLM